MPAAVVAAVVAAVATAAAEPPPAVDPDSVSPGLGGFLVVFALALATWFLARSMTGRLRNVRRRAELEAREGRAPGTADGDEGQDDATGAGGPAGRPAE